MTKLLEDAIAKVRELPEDEQNRAAGFLSEFASPDGERASRSPAG